MSPLSNPFAAPQDLKATSVIWSPSRIAYDALRIGHIVAVVAFAWLLFRAFRVVPSWDWITAFKITCSGTVLLATIWIVMRELWAYWTDDVQRERRILFIHAAYSLTFCALIGIVHFSGTASQRHITLLPLVFVAAWHISVVLRSSMLRQRAQFFAAQHGDSLSAISLDVEQSRPANMESWEVEGPNAEANVSTDPRVRWSSLAAWIRGSLLSRRGLLILGCVLGVCVAGVATARYLIPVEVDHYGVSSDGDYFEGSLFIQRGNLYAKCIGSQLRQNADGGWQQEKVTREVCIGPSTSVLVGKPSITFGGGTCLFTFYIGNRRVAGYDDQTRQFHVYE